MNIAYFLPLTMTVALLSSCANMPSYAPIDDRTNTSGPERVQQKQAASEVVAVVDQPGYYTVKKGDTLLRISQQFNLRLRDLVEWNTLTNPNDIKAGQQLRIQRPEGAQVAAVSMESGMEVRALSDQPAKAPEKVVDKQVDKPIAPVAKPPAGAAAVPQKTGPMGEKRPYSEQALAELQGQVRTSPARAPDPVKKPAEPAAPVSARFIWPTEGKLIQEFDPSRKGIDIGGQSGQPVLSASDGTVLYAKSMRGYGNLVIIDHADGLVSAYGHNKTILVKEGQNVTKGQRIAEMGDSDSDIVKLHFEIRQMGKPVDPVRLLPNR